MTLNAPSISVVNNVDVAVETESARIQDALSRQAMSPVRWVEVIQTLEKNGVSAIVECGPGKVLSGLIKRIAPSVASYAINDQASLDATLEALR